MRSMYDACTNSQIRAQRVQPVREDRGHRGLPRAQAKGTGEELMIVVVVAEVSLSLSLSPCVCCVF